MPTISLDKKVVLKLVGKHVSDAQLREAIPQLGTDLDAVTTKAIDVEIFPNRPDLLSEEGFARALSSFLGVKKGLREYHARPCKQRVIIEPAVKKIVPYTVAAIVKGLHFTEASLTQLMNLQEKLHTTHGRNRKRLATGVYDLSTIKFPLKLRTRPRSLTFQALDDKKERTVNEIITHHPKGKLYGHLVKGKSVAAWEDANHHVLSMPPVINSEPTKVTTKTKDIFIEVTGNNKDAVEQALCIQLAALVDRGGTVYRLNITPDMKAQKMKVNRQRIADRLGISLSEQKMAQLAAKMGLHYAKGVVTYPMYRADMLHEVDIGEDVAIAYGYQNIKPTLPASATIGHEHVEEKWKKILAEVCVGLGLQEVMSYHITSESDEAEKMLHAQPLVTIENALSEEYAVLRSWIIPSLLKILSENRHHEYPQNMFEIGKVFVKKGKSIKEPIRLGITLSHATADFTVAKKVLDAVCHSVNAKPVYSPVSHGSFIPGRCARVSVKGKDIAFVGEIHPEVITRFNMDTPVAAIELNVSELIRLLE